MTYEDDILAEARAAIGDLHSMLDEMREMTTEIIEEGARDIRQDEDRDEARARQARRGDFGPDWVRLQDRIDRGETSLSAIARGADDSPEAAAVRENTITNLVDLRLQMEQAAADGPDEELPVIRIRGEESTVRQGLPPEARQAMAQARASMARIEGLERRLREIPLEEVD